ncbi:MAG: AIPR family protein [Candidatus Pacebacteria bacterium]|nr:AIPR family protein [Candidatus Paceibacterota bacterium]
MTTQLQQRTVKEVVQQYSSLYGLQESKAFLFLVIEKYFSDNDLNSIDIEEAIVDGSDDCGIDAIVIDDYGDQRPNVYFFQSKFYQSEDAFEKNFEGEALDKIKSSINDFVLQGKINKKYQNTRLVDKLQSVKNLGSRNPLYTIVLCSNSKEPTDIAKSRLEEFITETNNSAAGEYISIEYLHLDRITKELIAPQQQRLIDINLQTSGKFLTEDTGNVRLFVGAVEAQILASLVEQYGNDLFEKNVRGFLGSNSLNKNIIRTATTEQSPYFVYMNNGITLTCERFTHSPTSNSPLLEIKNAQIVNGQQTVRSLHQASKSDELKPDVKVLIRIVETTNADLLNQIIEATNSQTKVTSRDLHSNDEVQRLIEEHLKTKGFFYEARKNKYKGKDVSKRVDAEIAAQSYYSIFFEQPAIAKDKKKLLFGDKYDELFNQYTKSEDILYSFKLLRTVQKLNNQDKYTKFTFLNDATLHIITLMQKISGKFDFDNDEDITTSYERVLKALKIVVDERAKEEGDKYEHRRTFKDPETYGRVVEVLLKK